MTGSTARAFAPGHITGIFRPAFTGRDPRASGSVGAGLVLALGATAEASWYPGRGRHMEVRSSSGAPLPITADAVARLLGTRGGRLVATVRPELPIGQGFGMSAAGTLAAALATASLFRIDRTRAVQTAHLADLFGLGGLGGVSAILGGGLELRRGPGVSPFGEVLHRRWKGPPVFLVRVGRPIPSPRILGDPQWLARIEKASEGLDGLLRSPKQEDFLDLAEQFTDRLRLGSPAFHRAIRLLRGTGCWAAQAMFGNTVFVTPRTATSRSRLLQGLLRQDWRAVEVDVGGAGARRLPPREPKAARMLPQRL